MRELNRTYRIEELSAISRCLRSGDSISVIGISGMGKSNLFRYFQRVEIRKLYFGKTWRQYLIVSFDANALGELTERASYELLIEALVRDVSTNVPLPAEAREGFQSLTDANKRPSGAQELKRAFMDVIRLVMNANDTFRIVFVFDQLDEVYRSLAPSFFANLRYIRDEFKYRISYLTFTREELPRLCSSKECDEFYELLSPNVIGLGPYKPADAQAVVDDISGRYGERWSQPDCEDLIALSGSHPGILKALCMSIIKGEVDLSAIGDSKAEQFLKVRDVNEECKKIWDGLDQHERSSLTAYVHGDSESNSDADGLTRLWFKHLIKPGSSEPIALCEVFTKHVLKHRMNVPAETRVQAGPIRIDSDGEVWLNKVKIHPPLTTKELLLLTDFCVNPGRLRSKDEIIVNVYPSEYASGSTVSDEALNALVRRLRERVEPISQGRCRIVTIRGKGYRLEIN